LTTARVVGGDLATLHRRAASLGPRHSVVVAVHDLELGQTVRARDVRAETRYASEIPRVAVTDPSDAIGRVVVVPVLRDAMIFAQHLAAANRSGLDAVVPVGDRAVHVVPKDGFRPPPGSIVDVLAAFDPTVVTVEGAGNRAVVVAGGARVLDVDPAGGNGSSGSAETGVTLLVTDTEARVVAFAAASADLTLAIAPPESACCSGSRP
jgi:Flp pilus assembly protein CpaB